MGLFNVFKQKGGKVSNLAEDKGFRNSFEDALTKELDSILSVIIKIKELYGNDKAYCILLTPCSDMDRSELLKRSVYKIQIQVIVVDSLYDTTEIGLKVTNAFYDYFQCKEKDSAGYNVYSCCSVTYYIGDYTETKIGLDNYLKTSKVYDRLNSLKSSYES